MTWPNNIPPDLRRQLDAVLSLRNCAAPDIWGEVRDWLLKQSVEAPARLPEDEKTNRPG